MFLQKIRQHVFYHADRFGLLIEGQELLVDEIGLSRFGRVYWPAFQTKSYDEMSASERREFDLERIRNNPRYLAYASRLHSIFAANTIAEAINFANSIVPIPNHPIPIIEIFAERYWNLDSTWLDYVGDSKVENYTNYWEGLITNHNPIIGERRSPRLEVMIALPATTGKVVHIVNEIAST